MLCFDKKKHIKSEKYVTPVDFAEHLRKSDLSENSKFITIDSYEIDSMKVIVILVKVDKMYNILRSAGMLLVCYWSRDKDEIGWSKFLPESTLECQYIYYAPPFLRGRLHLVRDTAAEKEFDIAI